MLRKTLVAILVPASAIFLLFILIGGYWHFKYPEPHWDWEKIAVDGIRFPKDFLWGVATAAHQVEGDCDNNNWSAWEKMRDERGLPRVKNGQSAGKACEHWQRYPEDIRLMQELNVKAFRFSVEWSKIEPREGVFNREALQHYRDVCTALRTAGIQPIMTLYHFTHPLWFEQKGAFAHEENIPAFVRFCEVVFGEYQDQVQLWCTINEPEVCAAQGYFMGIFPPGEKNAQATGEVLKNLLEAHTRAYHALKKLPGGQQAQIGLVKNVFQFDPFRRWHFMDGLLARRLNVLFNDAIFAFFQTGNFSFNIPGMVAVQHQNLAAKSSLDFIGLNYYSHFHLKFQWDLKQFFTFEYPPDEIMTDMPYTIYPEGFYRAVHDVAQLGVPIYVTENGIADAKDDRRAGFIRRYLYALQRAMQEGCPVRGYFYWSLLDNFEWAEGYDMKFGLYQVDFATQERSLRQGAKALVEIMQR